MLFYNVKSVVFDIHSSRIYWISYSDKIGEFLSYVYLQSSLDHGSKRDYEIRTVAIEPRNL